jgi:hypothetical protein
MTVNLFLHVDFWCILAHFGMFSGFIHAAKSHPTEAASARNEEANGVMLEVFRMSSA